MTYLDRIVAWHRDRVKTDARDTEQLFEHSQSVAEKRESDVFLRALRSGTTLNVIAEVKRRSPSKGKLADKIDPGALAVEYRDGGAAAVSVLTDGPHFGGSPEDLVATRAESALPVLRKDFTVHARDVMDACLMGADAVLLIVAALNDAELHMFLQLADTLRMAALVEVHGEHELDRAIDAGAKLIGVNQRDLVTFEVDEARAVSLAARIPGDVVAVAESGIRGVEDARRCAAVGYRAVLVGEHLVRSPDRVAAVRELRVPLPS